MPHIIIELDPEAYAALSAIAQDVDLTDPPTAQELVRYLVWCALEGYERPGSWERGWLAQATGWNIR